MSERIFGRIEKFFRDRLNQGLPSNSSFASNQRELDRNWSNFLLRLEEAAPQSASKNKGLINFLLPVILFALLGSLYFLHLNSLQLEAIKKTQKNSSPGYVKMDTVIKTIVIYQYDTIKVSSVDGTRPLLPYLYKKGALMKENDASTRPFLPKTRGISMVKKQDDLNLTSGTRVGRVEDLKSEYDFSARGAIIQKPGLLSTGTTKALSYAKAFDTVAARPEQILKSTVAGVPIITPPITNDAVLKDPASGVLKYPGAPAALNEPVIIKHILPGEIVSTHLMGYPKEDRLPVIVKKFPGFFMPSGFRIGLVSSFEIAKNYINRDQGCYGAGVSAELWFGRRLGMGGSVGNIGNNFVRNETSLDAYGLKWQPPWGYKTSQLYGSWRYMNYSVYSRYLLAPDHRWSPFFGVGTNWENDLPALSHYTIYNIITKIQSPYPEQSLYHNPQTRTYLNLHAGLEYMINNRLHGSMEAGYGKRIDSGTDQSASHIGLSAALWYNL